MRDMLLVDGPILSPGRCWICGGVEGKMIDTRVDVIGDGRTYLCLRTCLPLVAGLAGYATPDQVAEWAQQLGVLHEKVDELTGLLEQERAATLNGEDVAALKTLATRVRQQQAKPKATATAS